MDRLPEIEKAFIQNTKKYELDLKNPKKNLEELFQ